MSVKISPEVATSPRIENGQGDLSHVYCSCDDTVALCGWDLTNADEEWDVNNVCIVCDELDFSEDYVCPNCGE